MTPGGSNPGRLAQWRRGESTPTLALPSRVVLRPCQGRTGTGASAGPWPAGPASTSAALAGP